MSSFLGNVWLLCCILIAMFVVVFNIIWFDNVYPQIAWSIKTLMPHGWETVDMESIYFWKNISTIVIPLAFIASGVLGWYFESVIWGRSTQG